MRLNAFILHILKCIQKIFCNFYFLITYDVCKKRKYCNRMSEKKKFSPFDEFSCFVCLSRQNKQKNSFCLSVCLSGCTYVDFSYGQNNFRRSERIQTKFGGCLLCMKSRSGIEIQSKIMILILILILNRILI